MLNHPGAVLPRPDQNQAELALAARYAPHLLFDRHEPFLPLAAGYTLFHADGYSPSFPRCIGLSPVARPPAVLAIEYAIWWDWDIQHLYELEHFWTYVDAEGAVVQAEGSWHGDFRTIRHKEGEPPPLTDGSHPIAYAEPGKHAFSATNGIFLTLKEHTRRQCSAESGKGGVWMTPVSKGLIARYKTPEADDLVNAYLNQQAFEPAFVWEKSFDLTQELLLPWPVLAGWIPKRVDWLLSWLKAEI